MRKLLGLIVALLATTYGFAQSPVTVYGHTQSGNGSSVTTNSFVRFRLDNYGANVPRVLGTGIIVAPQPTDVSPNGSGQFTTTLWGNDNISPAGTQWIVEYWYNGQLTSTAPYSITGTSSIDLDNLAANSTLPVIPAPTGDSTYLRLDAGNASSLNSAFWGAPSAPIGSVTPVAGYFSLLYPSQLDGEFYVGSLTYPATQSGVQAAFTAACAAYPGGTVVHLPPQTISLTSQTGQLLQITCPLTVRGLGPLSTVLSVAGGVSSSIPVVRVKLGASPNNNHFQWSNIQIACASSCPTAGDGVLFDNANDSGGGPVTVEVGPHYVVSSGQLNGYALDTNSPNGGNAQLMWSVHDNVLGGGAFFDALADSAEILHNNFGTPSGSTHACITLTTASGSARQAIRDNNGSCAGGVLVVHHAYQLMFAGNQFEQTLSSTEANSAMVDLICDTSSCSDVQLWGNNLNTHNNATSNIRVGNASNTHIEDNTMTVTSTTGIGINITASASGTRFPYNSYNLPAPAGAFYSNSSATSVIAAQAPNGSKTNPAYAFINATSHGLYYRAGVLEMAVSGAAVMQWNGAPSVVVDQAIELANGQVDVTVPDTCMSRFGVNTIQFGNTAGICDASGTIKTGTFQGAVQATNETIGGGTSLARYGRYTPTFSPSSVAANTTAEQCFSSAVTSGDVIVSVSKPSAQAGLGIVGWRVSGTSACVTFSNNTASPITPTASETYQIIAVQ